MATSAGPNIVAQDRLVLNLDASDINSYPRSGTTWYDLSPYQNHGTLTNGPSHGFTQKNGNHYIDFDGTNDYVEFGNDASLSGLNDDAVNTAQQFSFEIVIDPDTHSQGVCVMGMGSFSSNTDEFNLNIGGTGSNRYGGTVRITSSNSRIYWTGDNSHTPVNGTQGNYQHIVMTVDETNGMRFYTNSVLASNQQSTNSSYSNVMGGHDNETNTFRIGQLSFGSYVNLGWNLNGRVSIVRVYNKSLTASEIEQNFKAQRARFNIV